MYFCLQMELIPEKNKIRCYCNNITDMVFGNSFVVAPNSIDFSAVFLKFSPLSQAAVMGTLAALYILYILAVILLRKRDRRDALKALIIFIHLFLNLYCITTLSRNFWNIFFLNVYLWAYRKPWYKDHLWDLKNANNIKVDLLSRWNKFENKWSL